MEGIKELKEAFVGVNELALCLIERLKDGVGVDDVMALFTKLQSDEEFKNKLSEAVKGYDKIPAEAKDLDMNEIIELAGLGLSYAPKYVEAFKKQ